MAKITVACNFPNGLRLELVEMVERSEPVSGGGRHTFTMAKRTGKQHVVPGPKFAGNGPQSSHRLRARRPATGLCLVRNRRGFRHRVAGAESG